jgi:hypothetical protein
MKLNNLTNKNFGKWTAKEYVRIGERGKWLCKCQCGTERLVWSHDLTSGRTTNCGCGKRLHGMTNSREFETWNSMRKRCLRKANDNYKNYGGRGITVCRRWLNSFANFYADMGPKPHGAQLDRINNNGPYSPENCRWVTPMQNANNRGNNRRLTYKGITKTLAQWSRALGGSPELVGLRLKQGWPIDDALTLPPNRGRRRDKHLLMRLRNKTYANI